MTTFGVSEDCRRPCLHPSNFQPKGIQYMSRGCWGANDVHAARCLLERFAAGFGRVCSSRCVAAFDLERCAGMHLAARQLLTVGTCRRKMIAAARVMC